MYAFYYDAPGSPQIYSQVSQEIGRELPDGLVVQLITRTDHGLRHLNVWRSRDEWESFRDHRVRPAVAAVLGRMGIPAPSEPPAEQELDLVDIGPLAGATRPQPTAH